MNFSQEFEINFSRSSGPGGQSVNKVNSKVELRFSITKSLLLSDAQKDLLKINLSNKINNQNEIVIFCQDNRSQLKNKENCIERLNKLINDALIPPKERKESNPPSWLKEKRLRDKKYNSQKKQLRIEKFDFN